MNNIQDLSEIHDIVSGLICKPASREEWEQYKLSEDQVSFFHEFGYLPGIKMLSDEQVEVLRSDLADIIDPGHPGNKLFHEFHSNESNDPSLVLFHALGAWRIKKGFHDILWNPAFLVPASQLLGNRAVRFWHDQLFCKPAKHGGVVAWHQDYSYWTRTVPMQHLTCWTGLDDADIENGCLYYVPGSHRWGLLEKPELAGNMEGLMDYLTDIQKEQFKPVAVELKKGVGVFHHPLMVHGSYANKTGRSRRAFVLNVFADGTLSHSDESLLQGIPVVPKGQQMGGQFFPLLYTPQ
ncbi:MAG: phytanoyl-CoA dioxygenase family protein [Chitinophagaceae bacterium]